MNENEKPKPKIRLVTSRKWDSPVIEAFVTHEAVGARMELRDFLTALAQEVDSPIMLTRAGLRAKLETAAVIVLKELRETTRYVI